MYSTYFLCSTCSNSGVKTTLKGSTFVVESRTYAQIFSISCPLFFLKEFIPHSFPVEKIAVCLANQTKEHLIWTVLHIIGNNYSRLQSTQQIRQNIRQSFWTIRLGKLSYCKSFLRTFRIPSLPPNISTILNMHKEIFTYL